MKLRKLEQKDAPFMLEWMKDSSVTEFLQTDFATKNLEDCRKFIELSREDSMNLHLAIVDEKDYYMGTVSLKNIRNGMAEFAITVRKEAMGKGYSKYGMNEILRIGLGELHLKEIYWCVNPENKRAVRFYDKNGYKRMEKMTETELKNSCIQGWNYSEIQFGQYIWYCINNKEI